MANEAWKLPVGVPLLQSEMPPTPGSIENVPGAVALTVTLNGPLVLPVGMSFSVVKLVMVTDGAGVVTGGGAEPHFTAAAAAAEAFANAAALAFCWASACETVEVAEPEPEDVAVAVVPSGHVADADAVAVAVALNT